jgi:hypothetical protein
MGEVQGVVRATKQGSSVDVPHESPESLAVCSGCLDTRSGRQAESTVFGVQLKRACRKRAKEMFVTRETTNREKRRMRHTTTFTLSVSSQTQRGGSKTERTDGTTTF